MKHRTKYQEEKANALNYLKKLAKYIKLKYPTDKPAQIMEINDSADKIQKCLPYGLTDKERERIGNALSELSCKLHPVSNSEKKYKEEQRRKQIDEENELYFLY